MGRAVVAVLVAGCLFAAGYGVAVVAGQFRATASTHPAGGNGSGASGSPNLLDRQDLIYSAEIGGWETDGGPAVDPATGIPAETRAAGIPLIRFTLYDCFTDMTCGSDHHTGTITRADFDHAVRGITRTDRAVLWLKLPPVTDGRIGAVDGTVFCPPWTGDAAGNRPFYKATLAEVRSAGYAGPIVIESSNEMEHACWRTWRSQGAPVTSAGSPGVSRRIGEHYAATMPALTSYATGLGFAQVVVGGYLGTGGGPGWGQPCRRDRAEPYGYACGYDPRWVDEFNTAIKAAGVAPPDFESIHAYPHSADFSSSPGYEFDDDIAYAYYRNWNVRTRAVLESIWGRRAGSRIRLAISEWNAGAAEPSGTWSGWTTPGRPEQFYRGWLSMLRGDGRRTTGSSGRYWEATAFEIASNSDTATDRYYNLIRADGSTPAWYATFKAIATGR